MCWGKKCEWEKAGGGSSSPFSNIPTFYSKISKSQMLYGIGGSFQADLHSPLYPNIILIF